MLKRHLTLIIKVDNPLRTTCPAYAAGGEIMRSFNNLPHYRRGKSELHFFLIALLNIFAATKPAARKMAEPSQSLTMY
jgi:hypothetical protein